MAKKKFRRKQYIINPSFQLKFSSIIVATLIIATLITAVFLYINILNSVLPEFSANKLKQKIALANQLRERQVSQYSKGAEDKGLLKFLFPGTAEMLADYEQGIVGKILHEVNRNLIPWILILIALVLSAGIFLTHRIAGPIYNFKKSLAEIENGNLTKRIYLRWSDEFKDLSAKINECVASIDKSTSDYKSLVKEIRQSNNSLQKSLEKSKPEADEIKNNLSKLQRDLDQLQQKLNFYKTTPQGIDN